MGTCKTFFAILKAYCAINVLLLPCSFANGGYILSPCAMVLACFFEGLCAARLTTVALQYEIYSYPLLMKRAMGEKGLLASRIFISIAHWQFTVGQLTFTLKSLQSTTAAWSGTLTPLWVFGLCIWMAYTPINWIRRLEYFSQAFIFAVSMIILAVIVTSVFAFGLVQDNAGEPGPDFVPINQESYWGMVGFAFFMFEGIGCLLPVMRETEKPEKLP